MGARPFGAPLSVFYESAQNYCNDMRIFFRAARNSRGSILFMILLAVVLFAALTYAVTDFMRGGGNNASSETNAIAAAQALQYFALIRQGIQRLKLINGCKNSEISLQNMNPLVGTVNTLSPATKSCHVFEPEGAGINKRFSLPSEIYAPDPPYGATAIAFQQGDNFTDLAWPEATNSCDEFVIVIRNVTAGFCEAYNKQAGFNWSSIPVRSGATGGQTVTYASASCSSYSPFNITSLRS